MTEDSPDAGDVKSTRLRELQALADEGLITPDEYEQHRRRIRGETGDGEPVDAATVEAATTGSHARRSPRPARRVDQQGVVPGHVGRQRELLPRGAQKRNASASRGKPKGSRAISGTGSLPPDGGAALAAGDGDPPRLQTRPLAAPQAPGDHVGGSRQRLALATLAQRRLRQRRRRQASRITERSPRRAKSRLRARYPSSTHRAMTAPRCPRRRRRQPPPRATERSAK